MTSAKFSYHRESAALQMSVKGHTGFAELGKDPVCAGASILAMTAVQCLMMMNEDGKFQKKPNVTVRNGRVEITVKPKPEHFGEAFHVFWMAQVGMRLLEESYPANITLTPFETALTS